MTLWAVTSHGTGPSTTGPLRPASPASSAARTNASMRSPLAVNAPARGATADGSEGPRSSAATAPLTKGGSAGWAARALTTPARSCTPSTPR